MPRSRRGGGLVLETTNPKHRIGRGRASAWVAIAESPRRTPDALTRPIHSAQPALLRRLGCPPVPDPDKVRAKRLQCPVAHPACGAREDLGCRAGIDGDPSDARAP